MYSSILSFRTDIGNVRSLSPVYSSLVALASGHDLSDMLRAQMIMATSALDHFIHNAIEEGMIEIYQNNRNRTPAFEKFQIAMKNVQYITINPSEIRWFQAEIREQIGYLSFQKSKNVSAIIKLISDKILWDEVGIVMSQKPQDIRDQLDLIIDRRNTIVHEADNDPSNPGTRLNITQKDVEDSIDFIEKVGEAIFQVIK